MPSSINSELQKNNTLKFYVNTFNSEKKGMLHDFQDQDFDSKS